MQSKVVAAVAAVIIAGVAFYAGSAYGKDGSTQAASRGQFGQNGQYNGQGGFAGRSGMGMRGGGGFSAGQIISQGNGSITIQLPNGSTQIVLVGTSTQILKSAPGTMSDLPQGTNVTIAGQANSDGSITANTIQIRPAGEPVRQRPQQTQ